MQPSAGAGDTEGTPAACSADDVRDSGPAPMRRLTRLEYRRTLQYLMQLPEPPDVGEVPAEAAHQGFTVHAELQTLSAQHLRAYLQVASDQADALLEDRARRERVVGCELEAADCLPAFVARFGRLVFRRPLSADERAQLVAAARDGAADGQDALRFALQAMLVSPSFLYRTELGDGSSASSVALTAYEVASRLAFAMLGRGPSAELLDLAEAGGLDTPDGLLAAAAGMAEASEFPEFYRSFFEQWLGFDRLVAPKEPPADWDDALLADMTAETAAVIGHYAWTGERFLDLLGTDRTVVTPALAAFYGLPMPGPQGVVMIPAGHPRAGTGLLTHASLISQKTDGDRIALRGNWLRRTFLCRNLEIPEAVAAEFGERLVGLTHTEIVRERNSDAACRGCHAAIDPIGVGFEGFDATGRFDPAFMVPDYGIAPALPDAPEPAFASVDQLAAKLRALPQVASCVTRRVFLFAHGREPAREDRCTLEAAEREFVASGHDFRALVQGLLTSPAFVARRPPEKGMEP